MKGFNASHEVVKFVELLIRFCLGRYVVLVRVPHIFNTLASADEMLTRLPRVVWAADDLMRDPASLPTLLLAEEASRSMKVVFSGEGGDEAFAGYGRYRTGAMERFLKGMLFPGTGGFRSRGDLRGGVAQQLLECS